MRALDPSLVLGSEALGVSFAASTVGSGSGTDDGDSVTGADVAATDAGLGFASCAQPLTSSNTAAAATPPYIHRDGIDDRLSPVITPGQ